MSEARKTLQSLQIIHVAFVFAAIAYIVVAMVLKPARGPALNSMVVIVFGLMAWGMVSMAFFVRGKLRKPAAERLKQNAEDVEAAGLWRKGTIVSLVLCEGVTLFGLALRVLGVGWNVCGIFYAVGIVLLLAWRPKLELLPE